uniref:NADH-ubiquinone oxidoreductase chain 5 n=1 Tax=Sphaerotheriidae sp. HYS-2012 TaxID=1170231 RepID=I6PDS3_9MYRI|nr:NADH dehydrogenase subunit 5 [Sphaerotheriidae sp. HYS-2012]AFH54818.1 NADH dehydrogenase subunit 5 [Sphaerotheriidae sp. HYS-2012]
MKSRNLSWVFMVAFLMNSVLCLTLSLVCLFFNCSLYVEWSIFWVEGCKGAYLLLIDWVSMSFCSFVLFISSMVIYYSESYLEGDLMFNRFCLLVALFVISMMLVILSPSFISILLGWDGLGLVSYCLVIYYHNSRSYSAGMVTVLSNRVGDVFLLISIGLLISAGSWNIFMIESEIMYSTLLGVLIIMAGFTKSAQIPFSAWLPAAMAAPTPVSALVHSSTLVTAGVYLLIRFYSLYSDTSLVDIFMLISCFTMFMAGVSANFECDLKKIIALSTLSQLGLMMSVLFLGFWKLAYYHLLTHAIFKALLFLCAGGFIHNMMEYQDIRSMGGVSQIGVVSCICLSISSFALCGFPFLAGFYSKDLVLEMFEMNMMNIFVLIVLMLSVILTCSYSVRLLNYLVWKNFKNLIFFSFSENFGILFPIFMLSFWAICVGAMLMWMIFPIPEIVYLTLLLKGGLLLIMIVGFIIGYILSDLGVEESLLFNGLVIEYFSEMWFMMYFSGQGFIKNVLLVGDYSFSSFDKGWFEMLGGTMMYNEILKLSSGGVLIQFNSLKVYLLIYFSWIVGLVGIWM